MCLSYRWHIHKCISTTELVQLKVSFSANNYLNFTLSHTSYHMISEDLGYSKSYGFIFFGSWQPLCPFTFTLKKLVAYTLSKMSHFLLHEMAECWLAAFKYVSDCMDELPRSVMYLLANTFLMIVIFTNIRLCQIWTGVSVDLHTSVELGHCAVAHTCLSHSLAKHIHKFSLTAFTGIRRFLYKSDKQNLVVFWLC